jgi:hypothetical protein
MRAPPAKMRVAQDRADVTALTRWLAPFRCTGSLISKDDRQCVNHLTCRGHEKGSFSRR